MGLLRDASPAKGRGVKATKNTSSKAGAIRIAANAGADHRGHTKSAVPRTIATRKPRRWGGKG